MARALAEEADTLMCPTPVFTLLPRERKCFEGPAVIRGAVCLAELPRVKPVDFNKRAVL